MRPPPIEQRYSRPPPQFDVDYHPTLEAPGARQSKDSVLGLHMPMIAVVLVCIFIATSTGVVVAHFYGLQHAISRLADQLEHLTETFVTRLTGIEEEVAKRAADSYTRTDQAIWCMRTELLNPDWRCARQGTRLQSMLPEPKVRPGWSTQTQGSKK